MRVLLINATYGDGSTGTIVKDIQNACVKDGMDCKVAYAYSSIPEADRAGWKIGNFFSNKLHAALSRINGQAGYFSHFTTLRLISLIDKYKPDIINIHNLHSNYVNLNMLLTAIAKRDIPLVVTLHDCWYFTGGCFHFTNAACDKWMTDCVGCPKKRQDTPAYLRDRASSILKDRYKYFNAIPRLHVIGVSEWITSLARRTVFKNAHCLTIHNGIDTSVFKPTIPALKDDLGLSGKRIILGPASKWLLPVNRKLLEETANRLKSEEVLLLFGVNGNVDKSLPGVKFFGFTRNKQQLAELYSIADIFVNCSREDTLSTINIEAQSCGVPIIAYANTGSTETVHPTIGKCIESGKVEEIIEAIDRATLKNEDVSCELHDWVVRNFEKSNNYRTYVKLFKEIVNDLL